MVHVHECAPNFWNPVLETHMKLYATARFIGKNIFAPKMRKMDKK